MIATVGLALKLALVASDAFPFNSDEAIVGLMARHILNGQWPAFFYGQAYMGSLDASLAALGFAILGEAVWVIRLLQALLYVATIMTTAALGWSIYRSAWVAWVAAALMAIPPVNVMLYTTVSLGGYGEALLIGNLLMLLALWVWRQEKGFALWGLLAGLGFWAFGLTLVFTIPTGFLVLRRLRHSKFKLVITIGAFLVGRAALDTGGSWARFRAIPNRAARRRNLRSIIRRPIVHSAALHQFAPLWANRGTWVETAMVGRTHRLTAGPRRFDFLADDGGVRSEQAQGAR